ncbi:hypothetical protein [Stigmatella aurantiaca]|uniref:Uncharacterized protein n=1 Tax=Stigmatella aurantiaca (strain DW4/3-1) TaxID=378806 RepID=E3FW83_STIAD|nr:hypothetical protein [Stigmatella aurantiaca]ADO75989.1 uncharacterized protein STAUR_8234 [Stigmatella aurantiaca DW4/3-1]
MAISPIVARPAPIAAPTAAALSPSNSVGAAGALAAPAQKALAKPLSSFQDGFGPGPQADFAKLRSPDLSSVRGTPDLPGQLGGELTPPDLSTQPVDGPNGTEGLASLLSHLIEALGGPSAPGPGGPNSEGPGSCGPGAGGPGAGGPGAGGPSAGGPSAGGPGAGGPSSLDDIVRQLTEAVQSITSLAQGVAGAGAALGGGAANAVSSVAGAAL